MDKMIKRILLLLCFALPVAAMGQSKKLDKKYGPGAVPVVEGNVVFEQKFEVPGKSETQIFEALKNYATSLMKQENSLPQCRITLDDSSHGLLAVNMEEWLYFKRTALVTNRARFYYQLLFQVTDSGYTATLRNIHYLYEEERMPEGGIQYEDSWITDQNALVKDGTRLSRLSGKFRTFTIDRKDQLFADAATATGGRKKARRVKKVVEVEVEDE